MVAIGQFNQLEIVKDSDVGVFLDGGDFGQILLPQRFLKDQAQLGDNLTVFIYLDSDDRLIATTDTPHACEGDFAWLKVVEINKVGAFLDWGLPKDLLLPFAQQKFPPVEGKRVLVKVYLDNSNRLAASSRIDKYLKEETTGYTVGQEVDLMVADKTELGFKAIVDSAYWGMLYSNEVFQPLNKGDRISGYVKRVRDDNRLDITLTQPGYEKISGVAGQILEVLKEHDGYLMITDKSSPETIRSVFKISKKVYKKAIGALYKQRRIAIEEKGIRLLG
ncbi:MAG: S1-like domain-containing RNA-binding protein [Oceanicoccus sp.]|uniref:CvfB family protein n=1 Tax=Oceanicoccus sp. TaxID=2691044 RepID=UPI0026125197|nr:S1-like domain-containing RNA-binding protein [Oceanicoccus sp.]MDG1772236.1 S1-like domain-containing RNA-binding protein [Oceanicoccus sp.]